MNRRTLIAGGIGIRGMSFAQGRAQASTPESLQDTPWLSGSSAKSGLPTDAVAASGTVQVVRVSPVLYAEFAAILIHNATTAAVMVRSVEGTLTAESLPGFEREQAAYGIPNPIIPPNEYWIGRLMVPAELVVGTTITFDAEAILHTELPSISSITTLLTAITPEIEFTLPAPGAEWPIRYQNDAPYRPADISSFQQVFFRESGEICGFISADDSFNAEGIATFPGVLTNNPGASTGGGVLGETTDHWLAQWSHQPSWTAFELFEPGK